MKRENNRGITLIALIITIILMLILAAVVLTLTIGENGLFGTAKYAVKKWNNSVEQENAELDELYAYINGETLPENTKDTLAGTLVAVPDSWKISTPVYVSTKDGKEVVSSKKISTVQAVATGEGETVPVPLGFYYVGGNLSTGVVISDNQEDRYGYNPITKKENDTKTDKTAHEYAKNLKGNQFVWIPCIENEYHKYNVWNGQEQKPGNFADAWWDKTTPVAETIQIKKYGGFYVGRFEAGIAKEMNEINNLEYNIEGKPQIKEGIIPWNNITWYNAKMNAENMYKTNNYVQSGMITGTQFDVILKTMVKKGEITEVDTIDPKAWGNCSDTTISYEGRIINVNKYIPMGNYSNEIQIGTTTVNANANGIIFSTGASKQCKKYNIYDIAGNLNEMTDEVSIYNDGSNLRMNIRGGSGVGASSVTGNQVCYRFSAGNTCTTHAIYMGFRVVLYMR